jgi:hypothetical protein
VLQEYRQAIEDAEKRLERLTRQVTEATQTWSMAPVIAAYQALRGVAFLTAVTFVAEIGDVRRFDSPRQLMAYLGLVPSESSTGDQVHRGKITKAGNSRARRVLIEGAWTYRHPARMSRLLQERQADLPPAVREIAWKAQVRLCGRYRKLMARGKRQTVVTTAIAREMAAFLWATVAKVPAAQRVECQRRALAMRLSQWRRHHRMVSFTEPQRRSQMMARHGKHRGTGQPGSAYQQGCNGRVPGDAPGWASGIA